MEEVQKTQQFYVKKRFVFRFYFCIRDVVSIYSRICQVTESHSQLCIVSLENPLFHLYKLSRRKY
jgi:hypothetical protein